MTINQRWMLVDIRYQNIDSETGRDIAKKEKYLIDAVSFTEAEARAYSILSEEIGVEIQVTNITPKNIMDIWGSDNEIWYEATINYIDADHVTGKEKKIVTKNLVNAEDVGGARERLIKELEQVLVPYEITGIKESKIIDVFPYDHAESEERCLKGKGFTKIEGDENSVNN